MIYDFICALRTQLKTTNKEELLLTLTDDEFRILEHIYLNNEMLSKEELKQYFDKGFDIKPAVHKTLQEIIRYAAEAYDDKVLVNDIASYLLKLDEYAGQTETRKVAKIILRAERIDGVTIKDIKKAQINRK